MKCTTQSHEEPWELPWMDSVLAPGAHVTQIPHLLAQVLSSPGKTRQGREAVARVILRWPNLRRAAMVPEEVLRSVGKLTRVQARRLSALLKAAVAISEAPEQSWAPMLTPEDVVPHLRGLCLARVERFWVIALDVGAKCLGIREVARGTLSGCQVPVREVFGFLLDFDAHRGIVAHNHPGGVALPSAEDLLLTRKLAEMGRDLGVPVVDHLIVTRSTYISLAALGEMA